MRAWRRTGSPRRGEELGEEREDLLKALIDDEVFKVPEQAQILIWIDLLALPELCPEERLEIAASLKQALFQGLTRQHALPVAFA